MHWRLQAAYRWLFADPLPVWIGLGAPIVALLAAWLLPFPGEFRVRIAGAVLTLLGIIQVTRGVLETQLLFGRPTYKERVAKWAARLPPIFKPRAIVMGASVATIGGSTLRARGTVRTNAADDSLEARVVALESNFKHLEREIQGTEERLETEIAKIGESVLKEQGDRNVHVSEIAKQLETYSTGGLDYELSGVCWVLFGQAFGSFPVEIAAALQRLLG